MQIYTHIINIQDKNKISFGFMGAFPYTPLF